MLMRDVKSTLNGLCRGPLLSILFFVAGCCITAATACDLPADLRDDATLFPKRVQQRFCHPDEGFRSLLLIRTAINENAPVFRIIAVKSDNATGVQNVRLFQFDQRGDDHPEDSGEQQAVIEFKSVEQNSFEARVKGKKSTVSFTGPSFEFVMHGIFGLRIKQPLDASGRITVDGSPTSVLLIRSSDKDKWQWVGNDGKRLTFRR